jgi:hypothetical protein
VAGSFIATLPSGAALAQASAVQCVINEQVAPPDDRPAGFTQTLDRYLRISGSIERWTEQDPATSTNYPVNVYFIPDGNTGLGYDVRVYGDPPVGFSLPPGRSVGDWFDKDLSLVSGPEDIESAAFLYLYGVESSVEDPSDVNVVPGSVVPGGCNIAPGLTWPDPPSPIGDAPPNTCFHPVAVQTEAGAMGNVPLTHSCLCSIDPTQGMCGVA